jgi:hypothetical protein
MKQETNAPPSEALSDAELARVVGGEIDIQAINDWLKGKVQEIYGNPMIGQGIRQAAQTLGPVYTPPTNPNDPRAVIFYE